jgi:hypothetical protein
VRVLRLYRMEVTSHSNLTLELTAPGSAELKLQLRNRSGNVIECDCEGSGSQTLTHQLQSGPVSVVIERFDPVFGWQFYRETQALVSGGLASVPFTPPAVGSWRAKATYEGSRTASPSAVGFTYLLVS